MNSLSEKSDSFFIFFALCALGFLAYGQTITYPFVHDEVVFIQNNPLIARFDWMEIVRGSGTSTLKWTSAVTNAYYRPLLELFYRMEYALFGLHPAGWHFLNIFIHIANSLFVYGLVNMLSGKIWDKEWFSFAAALFFLLHPVQTESVACISGISNLLFTFFSLVSVYFYFLGLSRGADAKIYAGSLGAFSLALLAKEQAVMLPVLILWLEAVVIAGEGRSPSRIFLRIGGYFAVLAGYFILRKFLMAGGAVPAIPLNSELFLRILSIPRTLLMYLGTILSFHDLHYYRSIDILEPAGPGTVGLLAVVSAVILILRRAPRPYRRLLLAGAGWFGISLLPVLNVVPIINEYSLILTAEHFLYLPLVGIVIFIVGLGHWGASRMPGRRQGVCAAAAVGVLGLIFLGTTMRQNTVWAGEIPLLERTVRFEPGFGRARMLLAGAYYRNGEYAKSIAEFRRALDIMEGYLLKTEYPPARAVYAGFVNEIYIGLAHCFEAAGDSLRALEAYARAWKFAPGGAVIDP